MPTKTISVTEDDVEIWEEAARVRGGGKADGWRASVVRDLISLLPGGEERDAVETLGEAHGLLLRFKGSGSARVTAERIEGIVRRLDPAAAAALTEARQAQAGGGA